MKYFPRNANGCHHGVPCKTRKMKKAPLFPSTSETKTGADIHVHIYRPVAPNSLGRNVFAVHMVETRSHLSESLTVAHMDEIYGLVRHFISKVNNCYISDCHGVRMVRSYTAGENL